MFATAAYESGRGVGFAYVEFVAKLLAANSQNLSNRTRTLAVPVDAGGRLVGLASLQGSEVMSMPLPQD